MCRERVGQRRAASDRLEQPTDELALAGIIRDLAENREGAVERQAGAQQRRQLSGEQRHGGGGQAPATEQAAGRDRRPRPGLQLVGADRQVSLRAQPLDDGAPGGRLHLALEKVARRRNSLVSESRHAGPVNPRG